MAPRFSGGGEDVWTGCTVVSPQGPAAGHRAKSTMLTSVDLVVNVALSQKVPVEV